MRKGLLVALGCALALGGCVEQHIARSRVAAALTHAGLSDPMAQCMATRMVDHLTIAQLRKLEALRGAGQGPGRSTLDYVAAVQRVNDPEVIRETVTAAGTCAAQVGGLGDLLH
jgi:hypothetical protein